jgi:hypothetical protein
VKPQGAGLIALPAEGGQAHAVLARTILALAVLAVAAPRADAKPGCRSGHTEFTHGHTRIFSVYHRTEWRICSLRLRRPRTFAYGNEGALDSMYMWQARGTRVAYQHGWIGGDEEGWAVGWVDITTGASHEATVANTDGITDIPVADGADAIAPASDGSIAFVLTQPAPETGQIIGYVPYAGRFGKPRVIVTVAAGDVVPASLSLNGDTIGWRTAAGAQISARVSAVAAAASSTVTIIGARARMASAAAPRPTTRASTTSPWPSLDSVS